jgi:hypothetical protein
MPFRSLLPAAADEPPVTARNCQVTSLSGYLYKFSKDERRAKLIEALSK